MFQIHHSGSTGNLYQAGSLLIEAGVPIAKIKESLNFGLSKIDGCICSHSHKDHCKGVPGLIRAGINCYLSAETLESLKISGHRVHTFQAMRQFKVGPWAVLPFDLPHDVPNHGFLVSDGKNKLLYASDCYYIHHQFRGLTHIAVECNWSAATLAHDLDPVIKRRLYRSHFSLDNVITFLRANDLSKTRAIYLIHISSGNGDPEYFKREVEKATGVPAHTNENT
jgi:phosphoribosyl 1,2-cyclic phosphodiesterase